LFLLSTGKEEFVRHPPNHRREAPPATSKDHTPSDGTTPDGIGAEDRVPGALGPRPETGLCR